MVEGGLDLQWTEMKLKCGFLETNGSLTALSCAQKEARAPSSISREVREKNNQQKGWLMVNNGRKEENRGELVKRTAQDIWVQGSLAWPLSFRLRKDNHGDGYVWRKRVSDGGAQAQERRLVIYTSNKVFCQGGDERVEGEFVQ